ncbi:zinc finger HIT domain-containing protein 2-like [Amphiura filiformis]|uniref:zinc finger HIT domain-containing protein 2-like n=1 Tax=Amphiura filiformis TaxID=82378 RepID=UPI003B222C68
MDAPCEENVLSSTVAGICRICLKQSCRYTCPRCNIPYCTLTCYKSEGHVNCSETFYKENFLQALKETKGSSEDKKKILEILQRVEDTNEDLDSDDDSDETADSLERRLADLDLDQDADAVWERLTEKEKHEFEQVLKAGKLGDLLDAWTPWWIHHERGLIVDLPECNVAPITPDGVEARGEQTGTTPNTNPNQVPKIMERIPKLSDLLKSSRPSDLVVYNLTNVLYCYAYITRLHNGAHFELSGQATQGILDLSQVLSANRNFSSTEEAIQSAVNNITQNPAYFSSNLLTISIVQDVVHILLGQSKETPLLYTLAALSDLYRLLSTAKKTIDKDMKDDKKSSKQGTVEANTKDVDKSHEQRRTLIFQCRKKVEFFLAWTSKCGKFLGPVAAELQLIYKSRLAIEEQHSKHQAMLEKAWGGHTKPAKATSSLIQEL